MLFYAEPGKANCYLTFQTDHQIGAVAKNTVIM